MSRMPLIAAVMLCAASPGAALEGGTETYLLGSRDSFAGIVPGPGTYLNNDFVYFTGAAPTIPVGGLAVTKPKLGVFVYKLNATHVFDAHLWGGQLGLNVNVPMIGARMNVQGELGSGLSGGLQDSESGLGDVTVTPLMGWHSGNLHAALALQFFLPTGTYAPGSVDVAARGMDVLSTGKNRFGFDPTLSLTWFDPETGRELSGAMGVTFSARNDATDYQTAPELHLEATAAQHLANGMTLGVTGYGYMQLDDDGGSGADGFKAATGAASLRAQVFGIGPMIGWSTRVQDHPVTIKAKYITEFGAKRRFESDKFWVTLGVGF